MNTHRDAEKEGERLRDLERQQEWAYDKQELARMREQLKKQGTTGKHEGGVSYIDTEGISNQDGQNVNESGSDHQVQQLKLILEQKERLLLSQTATASALETAVEALKGQVLSGKRTPA